MTELNTDINNQDSNIKDVDIKAVVAKFLNHWYLFLISVIICMSVAIIKGNLTAPVWKITAKILVDDQDDNSTSSAGGGHAELSSLLVPKHNIGNEIEILSSRSLIRQIVEENNMNIKTYVVLQFKSIEIFNPPFNIHVDYKSEAITTQKYKIDILSRSTFNLSNKKESVNILAHFGDTIKLSQYNIILSQNQGNSGRFEIGIESDDNAINEFLGNFHAIADEKSSTINLTYNYTHPQKGQLVLENLINKFVFLSLQNKLASMDSAINFINGRLLIVGAELDTIQKQLVKFKQDNQILDIADKSTLVGVESGYANNLIQQDIQIENVKAELKGLKAPGNSSIPAPVSMGNGLLAASIDSYNTLLLNKEKNRISLTDDNPIMLNIDKQLQKTRATLISGLEAYLNNLIFTRSLWISQDQITKDKLKDVPDLQRKYQDFLRRQNLKEDLYLFLLQKKEELSITKTSTVSNAHIIEHAQSASEPFEPKKQTLYLIGMILGILIPTLYIAVKEFFNTKVTSKYDIERRTSIPIVGEIGNKKGENSIVVTIDARSNISEQFRSLRTNLQYLVNSNRPNVLMFTSSMSGEGKTFLSLNLGSALGLAGKRVIFIELDLRKPKFSFNLGMDNSMGVTNYLISADMDYHSIIQPTWFSENCFLISSGPIPPNPSELLMSPKLERLIDALKSEYDYIIIDTAPVGVVTDGLLIERLTNITFYVIRQEYTHKLQINMINNLKQSNKIRNPYIIINDIKPKKGNAIYGYGYGYGYGHGYDSYNYREEKEKTSFWSKLFS